MKDELIKYDTAVLAKEKGFDEPCLFFFREDKTEFNLDYISQTDRNSNYNKSYGKCTQSLLQRWLREVHHIFVYVIPSYTTNEQYMIEIQHGSKLKTSATGLTEKPYYSTWEKALEEGLKQALLLL